MRQHSAGERIIMSFSNESNDNHIVIFLFCELFSAETEVLTR